MPQKPKRNERSGFEMAKKGFIAEFKEFIARGNVMDLAVGVIIGGAFQSIVNSLVNDMIMPVISLLTGGVNFSNWVIRIGSGENDTIKYGNFITAVINFLLMRIRKLLKRKLLRQMRPLSRRMLRRRLGKNRQQKSRPKSQQRKKHRQHRLRRSARTACQKSRSRQPDVHTVHLSFRLRIRTKKNKEKTGIIRQRGT